MTLNSLFDQRYSRYLKDILKYTRHIVNDHFIFILGILLAAAGIAYSDFLETLTPGMIEPRLFLVAIYLIATSTGHVTLLLEPADQIFLLPKENEFRHVFKKLTTRSYLESLIVIAILTFITFPLVVATLNAEPVDGLLIFLTLAGLKWHNLLSKIETFFDLNRENHQKQRLLNHLSKLLALVSLLFLSIQWTSIIVIGLAIVLAFLFYTERIFFNHVFKWQRMIEAEENRLQRLYRFISQFTDVPTIEPNIKRFAWLDKPIQWLSKRTPQTSFYYLVRLFTRNPEYSMLVLRLTFVAALLLAFTQSFVLALMITVLFLYLIGFQLLSLRNEMTRLPQFQMYPVLETEKSKAVTQIIFQILILVTVVLTLAALNAQGLLSLTLLPVGLLFAFLFCRFYAPRRL
jgi:ABC-2 type transport system permease protein